jgi:hypothetical protein
MTDQPPPAPTIVYIERPPGNPLAFAGMIIGIVAVVLAVIPVIGVVLLFIPAILAIIFGIIGLFTANRLKGLRQNMALAGIMLGVGAFVLAYYVNHLVATGHIN